MSTPPNKVLKESKKIKKTEFSKQQRKHPTKEVAKDSDAPESEILEDVESMSATSTQLEDIFIPRSQENPPIQDSVVIGPVEDEAINTPPENQGLQGSQNSEMFDYYALMVVQTYDFIDDIYNFREKYRELSFQSEEFNENYTKKEHWNFEDIKSAIPLFSEELLNETSSLDQKMRDNLLRLEECLKDRLVTSDSAKTAGAMLKHICLELCQFAKMFYIFLLAKITSIPKETFRNKYQSFKSFPDYNDVISYFCLLAEKFHRYKISSLIKQQIDHSALDLDYGSFRLNFVSFCIEEMFENNEEVVKCYSEALELGRFQIYKVDELTDQGKILSRAELLLKNLLKTDYPQMKAIREFYYLLHLDEETARNLPDNYLTDLKMDEVDKLQISNHIIDLMPNYFAVSPLMNTWAAFLKNRDMIFHEGLFFRNQDEPEEDYINQKAIQAMFILIHELAHKAKSLNLANKQLKFETPENVRRICRKNGEDQTTGYLLEKHGFGGKIIFDTVLPLDARNIFSAPNVKDNWDNIVKNLLFESQSPLSTSDNDTYRRDKKRIIGSNRRQTCAQRRIDKHDKGLLAIIEELRQK